ncbi:hypothetical protein [Alysiella crassa]|uniref:hypothetical protein n=1 Tax=Alysiella crassa TaxID=153491 RepID=UPI0009FE3628|nr:hypothetical protein [Alysiella crassa]
MVAKRKGEQTGKPILNKGFGLFVLILYFLVMTESSVSLFHFIFTLISVYFDFSLFLFSKFFK